MKLLLVFVIVTGFLLSSVTMRAETQTEMASAACRDYKKSDDALNKAYRRVLKTYAKDSVFIEKLKTAQNAWLQFRDAHLAALYPQGAEGSGSVFPMCRCNALRAMTDARLETLKPWVASTTEGDVCAGSARRTK